MAGSRAGGGWIGPAVPVLQIGVVMAIALQTSLVAALQPMLFSALAAAHRLSPGQIGAAATLELSATGIIATLAIARLPPRHIRPIVAAAALGFAAANLATGYAPPLGILAARTLSGCCSGIFMWQLVALLSRAAVPARLNGIYLAVQGLAGLLAAGVFANLVLPRYGAWGGFTAMAGAAVAAAAASWLLPRSYAELRTAGAIAWPNRAGWFSLEATFILMAATVAAWIYLPPLARQHGYAASVIGVGTPLTLGAEIVGGLLAAASATWLSWKVAVPGATIGFAAIVVGCTLFPPGWAFTGLMGVFGLLWMFVVPFQFSHAIAADPSRATLMFVSPAQLLGCGAGPMLAALGVVGGDVRGAEWVAVAMFAVSLLCCYASLPWRPAGRRAAAAVAISRQA